MRNRGPTIPNNASDPEDSNRLASHRNQDSVWNSNTLRIGWKGIVGIGAGVLTTGMLAGGALLWGGATNLGEAFKLTVLNPLDAANNVGEYTKANRFPETKQKETAAAGICANPDIKTIAGGRFPDEAGPLRRGTSISGNASGMVKAICEDGTAVTNEELTLLQAASEQSTPEMLELMGKAFVYRQVGTEIDNLYDEAIRLGVEGKFDLDKEIQEEKSRQQNEAEQSIAPITSEEFLIGTYEPSATFDSSLEAQNPLLAYAIRQQENTHGA